MAKIVSGIIGYTVQLKGNNFSPLDSTTYFFGLSEAPLTTEGVSRVAIPKSGTIKRCYIEIFEVAGSNEVSTISIRVNNATDTVVSNAVANDQINVSISNTNLSIAVNAGDYIELKWVTPAWVTNPTNIRLTVVVYIE